jgi:hypothetical protein
MSKAPRSLDPKSPLGPPVISTSSEALLRGCGATSRRRRVRSELRWYWTIPVTGAHEASIRTSGRAGTFEAAKAVQANYRRWLIWANLEVES